MSPKSDADLFGLTYNDITISEGRRNLSVFVHNLKGLLEIQQTVFVAV